MVSCTRVDGMSGTCRVSPGSMERTSILVSEGHNKYGPSSATCEDDDDGAVREE